MLYLRNLQLDYEKIMDNTRNDEVSITISYVTLNLRPLDKILLA